MGARGNSGVILSQIIRGFSKSIEGKEQNHFFPPNYLTLIPWTFISILLTFIDVENTL